MTRASSSSPAPRRDEGAQGRGCHGPFGTPVAQLRGRFRALCLLSDTLAGSAPSPATGTERTLSSEPRALQPHGAAERALSVPTRVCKSEVENSRRAQPPPSSPAPPQPWLGVVGGSSPGLAGGEAGSRAATAAPPPPSSPPPSPGLHAAFLCFESASSAQRLFPPAGMH